MSVGKKSLERVALAAKTEEKEAPAAVKKASSPAKASVAKKAPAKKVPAKNTGAKASAPAAEKAAPAVKKAQKKIKAFALGDELPVYLL